MTHFQLKNYQTKTLRTLREYLEDARFRGAKAAYENRDKDGVPSWSDYKPLKGMENVPFACLRLPTGGGNTPVAFMDIILLYYGLNVKVF